MFSRLVLHIGTLPRVSEPLLVALANEPGIQLATLDGNKDNAEVPSRLPDTDTVLSHVRRLAPDMLLLFDTGKDKPDAIEALCQALREAFGSRRPEVVVVTPNAALGAKGVQQRISWMVGGADDTLPAEASTDELAIRVLSHLRRQHELQTQPMTGFATVGRLRQGLLRRLQAHEPWALLCISLGSFSLYRELYGDIPATQVIRTLAALLEKLVPDSEGGIAHGDNDTFWVLLAKPGRAEKLADLLCRQFDLIAPNFHSDRDRDRGFLVNRNDHGIDQRAPLLHLAIGLVTIDIEALLQQQVSDNPASALQAILGHADHLRLLASQIEGGGSQWLGDRPKLSSPDGAGARATAGGKSQKGCVLVVANDAAMAYLLKTTLEMQGFDCETTSDPKEALENLVLTQGDADHLPVQRRHTPLVIIDLDADDRVPAMGAMAAAPFDGLALCEEIADRFGHIKTVYLSTQQDRDKALGAGADVYLPKPFDMVSLLLWVEKLVR